MKLSSLFVALVTLAVHLLLLMFSFFQVVSEVNGVIKFWAVSIYIPIAIGVLAYCSLAPIKNRSATMLVVALDATALALWLLVVLSSF